MTRRYTYLAQNYLTEYVRKIDTDFNKNKPTGSNIKQYHTDYKHFKFLQFLNIPLAFYIFYL